MKRRRAGTVEERMQSEGLAEEEAAALVSSADAWNVSLRVASLKVAGQQRKVPFVNHNTQPREDEQQITTDSELDSATIHRWLTDPVLHFENYSSVLVAHKFSPVNTISEQDKWLQTAEYDEQ
ncbi:hypothetical protein INR49_023023 [Caranx melampygus]|nr:hypothetical protein INR49_023023 [Caranx melampygus]